MDAPAWFGKHPAFGDFVVRGVAAEVADSWQTALDGSLAGARAELGAAWEETWDATPPIRFWAGGDLPGGPLIGVMLAARDSVGRCYPLIALAAGSSDPPPLDYDRTSHDVLEEAATAMLAGPGTEGAAFAPALDIEPAALWASNGAGDTDRLLEDVAAVDYRRAARGRSYWWRSGPGQAAVVATPGLPEGGLMAWLLRGYSEGEAVDDGD